MAERPLQIAVIGAGEAGPELAELARAVGREAARAGGREDCAGASQE